MKKESNPIREEKLRKYHLLKEAGISGHPHNFKRDLSLTQLREQFESRLEAGDSSKESVFGVAGRVMTKRPMGKAAFLDIRDQHQRLQIYVRKEDLDAPSQKVFSALDIGDILGVKGFVFKTRKGELSLHAVALTMVCKTLEPLPEKYHGLTNVEHRYRYRHMDLVMNHESRKVFEKRSQVIACIREFLNGRGFLEVETPVLQPIYGGAAAQPFKTHHNTLDMDLFLKISPELYLKRLIVGGFDKVYEIGKNFRNEGIDRTHNPEFTMLEFYESYTDYHYQMDQFEELVGFVVEKVCGSRTITYQGKSLDFSKPWKRISIVDALQSSLGLNVQSLSVKDLESEVLKHNPKMLPGMTKGQLIMELFEHSVEETLWQPTFVMDFPKDVSPLTKDKRENSSAEEGDWVERFEPMVAGMELGNSYSELNDPVDQRQRLEEQCRVLGGESQPMDQDFLHAIDVGMPPTGGVGLGVERLVMLVTDQASIRDILFFPTMRSHE